MTYNIYSRNQTHPIHKIQNHFESYFHTAIQSKYEELSSGKKIQTHLIFSILVFNNEKKLNKNYSYIVIVLCIIKKTKFFKLNF